MFEVYYLMRIFCIVHKKILHLNYSVIANVKIMFACQNLPNLVKISCNLSRSGSDHAAAASAAAVFVHHDAFTRIARGRWR